VCEVTDLVDLANWPQGTRLIVRREPLHPGAQHSLFPSLEYRYWGHYTDQTGDPVTLDTHMRAHAHVEDHIRRLKDSGLERFPFVDLDANQARLAIVAFAADLVRWFQLDCLDGPLAVAEPKTLRWQLWHTPARIVRRARQQIVRILDDWPTADALTRAYQRVALIT
jgi:Transposase DDE domain group 1